MRVLFRCYAIATIVVFLFEASPAAFGQVSFGIGSPAEQLAEERISQQLASRDVFIYEKIPLDKFAQLLRDRYSINVEIDQRALEDFGIGTQTPLSIHLLDATLESALNVALDPVELTWMIRDESLVITTPEEAESQLETRLYPVRDLVVLKRDGKVETDFDTLIRAITSTIRADSWTEVGGPGSIEPQAASVSLIICQAREAHLQIEWLLTAIREVRDRQGILPVSSSSRPHTVSRSTPRPIRRYRASANANWQMPRVYE
jgi:hypothetical protein